MNGDSQSAIEIRKGLRPAPGELRLVQAFVNTIDHERGHDELESAQALAEWLASRRLIATGTQLDDADLERAVAVRSGLRAIVASTAPREVREALEQAVAPALLRARFPSTGGLRFEPVASALDGAIGRLLVIIGSAQGAGHWPRIKRCAEEGCRAVFYDRSANRHGLWCSARCGNRVHALNFRRRERRREQRYG